MNLPYGIAFIKEMLSKTNKANNNKKELQKKTKHTKIRSNIN